MSRKVHSERCEAYWECSSGSCNVEEKSQSGLGFRLANDCQARRATASLVLEVPPACHQIAGKGIGDEQISQVMWGCSEERKIWRRALYPILLPFFSWGFVLFFKDNKGKKRRKKAQACVSKVLLNTSVQYGVLSKGEAPCCDRRCSFKQRDSSPANNTSESQCTLTRRAAELCRAA